MTHRKLIEQMLEAVVASQAYAEAGSQDSFTLDNAITAARAYLAAPEQSEPIRELEQGREPVAIVKWAGYPDGTCNVLWKTSVPNDTLLYTRPAPKAPEQSEPVNQMLQGCACRWDADDNRVATCVRHKGWLDVVQEWSDRAKAAEQAPQPTELTDEEAGALFMKDLGADYLDDFVRGVRAAEQAHGITVQKGQT